MNDPTKQDLSSYRNIDELVEMFQRRKDSVKRQLLRLGCEINKDYFITAVDDTQGKKGGQNKETILLSPTCFDQLRLQMFFSSKRHIPEFNDVSVKVLKRYAPKEQEILDFVCRVYSKFSSKREYKHNTYRIDLYFIDHKLAIECDENGHKHYDQNKEKIRERFLAKELGCRFIRFNPDDSNF